MAYGAYSVPAEADKILRQGILDHASHADLPAQCREMVDHIQFVGSVAPKISINWRFAESVSALKGLEAVLLNVLLAKRYNVAPQQIVINTDHAQLFLMSALITEIDSKDPKGPIQPTELRELSSAHAEHFPSCDIHQHVSSMYRKTLTNIFKCRDGKFQHVHAGLNPDPSLEVLGMPRDMPSLSVDESLQMFIPRLAEKNASEWDELLGEKARQASTTCHSSTEYKASPQGRAIADVGLYKIQRLPYSSAPSAWWNKPAQDPSRPLTGLKVIDLTRIIAGPSITRSLAELGASVMRVTAPHIADYSGMHPDMNWGKWNCHLNLANETDRLTFRELLNDADVVVNGYRPGVLDKYGLGHQDVLKLAEDRGRGLIYVRENCFGWNGPLAHRSGWQPISDAVTGVSAGFGRAMGVDEPVTPVLPNSDYCTGIIGSAAVLQALISQYEHGGSYLIDAALSYYNTWLTDHVGEYPAPVWDRLWTRHGRQVFRHYHNMAYLLPKYMNMFKDDNMFDPDFFEIRESKALGIKMRTPKPVLQFPTGLVRLGYNVGTRGNGVDQPRWPADLDTEIVV